MVVSDIVSAVVSDIVSAIVNDVVSAVGLVKEIVSYRQRQLGFSDMKNIILNSLLYSTLLSTHYTDVLTSIYTHTKTAIVT